MRGIPSWPDRLRTEAEGDIEPVDGVLRVTRIRVTYHVKIPSDRLDAALRALEHHHHKCPVHNTIVGCVDFDIRWQIEEVEPVGLG